MERCTKTDLRRTPPAPSAPRPPATGEEEHALLFGEAGGESHANCAPQPDDADEDAASYTAKCGVKH